MDSLMLQETQAIPALVEHALGRQEPAIAAIAKRIAAFAPEGFCTVARGTSDHAADYALRLVATTTGLIGASLPPSLVTLADAPLQFERHLVLAISQSGRSPDVVEPMQAARAKGALTVAIVNDGASPLAKAAELVLEADAGTERSVAATKSFVLSLLQVVRLVAELTSDDGLRRSFSRLPAALDEAISADWHAAMAPLEAGPSLFVVGRGLAHVTAREAALKLKETCGIHGEAVSGAEIMHGPKALIGAHSPVLMFASTDLPPSADEAAVRALAGLSDRLLVAAPRPLAAGAFLPTADAPHPSLGPLVDITAFYVFADRLSRARGRTPDAPPNLEKVTETR
ncbi:MAG: SIS domain-containing protein [Pseudomonadota bacterium]